MKKNEYICPNCGTTMNGVYEKPALNLICPKCGAKIATTVWDEIDLDDKEYTLTISPCNNPSIEQIKSISKITGLNYIEGKEKLANGKITFKGSATKILKIQNQLNENSIRYKIEPKFNY